MLAERNNLDCRFCPFNNLSIFCIPFLTCRVLVEISAVSLIRISLYAICCCSRATFNIFSLCLALLSLISMYLDMFLFVSILYGFLWASWIWVAISLPLLRKFSIISSNIFSYLSFYLFLLKSSIIQILVCLMLSQRSLKCSSFFSFFFLYSALLQLFPPFYLLFHFFILLPHLYWYLFPLIYF